MNEFFDKNEIMNIQQTVQRAKKEGIPLSAYTLRRAIQMGEIPCRVVGRTFLIPWANVVKWVYCEDEFTHLS